MLGFSKHGYLTTTNKYIIFRAQFKVLVLTYCLGPGSLKDHLRCYLPPYVLHSAWGGGGGLLIVPSAKGFGHLEGGLSGIPPTRLFPPS